MVLTAAHVDAKYGELYSKIVDGDNSDLWPAKWIAARSILRNDLDFDLAFTRLRYLVTDKEILVADGRLDVAIHTLAQKIWDKNTHTANQLFELDGHRRRFYSRLPDLKDDPAMVEDLIRSTLAALDRVLM